MLSEQELAELQRTLSSVSEHYRQQMGFLAEKFAAFQMQAKASIQPLQASLARINWPNIQVQMEQSSQRLANLGWTIPMSFAPRTNRNC